MTERSEGVMDNETGKNGENDVTSGEWGESGHDWSEWGWLKKWIIFVSKIMCSILCIQYRLCIYWAELQIAADVKWCPQQSVLPTSTRSTAVNLYIWSNIRSNLLNYTDLHWHIFSMYLQHLAYDVIFCQIFFKQVSDFYIHYSLPTKRRKWVFVSNFRIF